MIESTISLINNLFSPSYEGFLLVDSKSLKIQIANPSIEKMLGFEKGELLNFSLEEILPQDGLFLRMVNVLNQSDLKNKFLWQLKRKDGKVIHIEFMIRMIRLPGDDESELMAIYVEDKSQIKELEIQINYTQNFLHAIRAVKQVIQEDKDSFTILDTACQFLQKSRQFDFVWGILRDGQQNQTVFYEKEENNELKINVENQLIENPSLLPIQNVLNISDEQFYLYSNESENHRDWCESMNPSGSLKGICIPIAWNGKIYGAFEIVSFQENSFLGEDISILHELGIDIGFAIYSRINEEERFKALKQISYQAKILDTLEIPIFSLDQYLRVQYANVTSLKTLGLSFPELKKLDLIDLLCKEGSVKSSILQKSVNIEIQLTDANGRELSMMFQSSIIRDDNGDFQGLMIILFDFTELKNAQSLIISSEEKLRTIFATMNNGIVVVNEEGIIQDIAPIFKFLLFQVVPLEKGDYIFSFLKRKTQDVLLNAVKESQKTQTILTREFNFQILNEEFSFEIRFIPVRRYSNIEKVIMLVFSDTTEAKRIDRQLIESMKFASIGEIAAGLAHEINNPLQSALLYLDDLIVVGEEDPSERKAILKKVESANLRIRDLVKSLLDLGRMESPNRDLVSPYYILVRASELVEVSCKKKGIEFTRHAGPNLPGIFVRWQEIEQVLINCVVNSINAISEMDPVPKFPKIEIGIDLVRISKKDWVVFSIEDNGPGMSESVLDKAFLPLFTTRREKQGTGLGLSISKKIINEHEGDILIKSKLGEGTKIEIFLPAYSEINE
ncbi:ATP-binding protein [Leptospira idonii]|uniref:histidine kinase n=1 Tax=Leptospira idonii TaxID=1193500 RepID=A0A4R9M6V0_9LEPT|nr:ATP-binding protein [Leptospira idonii]TGN20388.1 PAS domain-containing protein [Leptospira idonii]